MFFCSHIFATGGDKLKGPSSFQRKTEFAGSQLIISQYSNQARRPKVIRYCGEKLHTRAPGSYFICSGKTRWLELRSLQMWYFIITFFNISHNICHSGLYSLAVGEKLWLECTCTVAPCAGVLSANVFLHIAIFQHITQNMDCKIYMLEKKQTPAPTGMHCGTVCSLQMCFFRLWTVRKGLLWCINTNLFHRPQIHFITIIFIHLIIIIKLTKNYQKNQSKNNLD